MITVLLVDDHPVVIEGLRKVLATAGDISVTGEAHDAAGALTQAAALRPDVILLDLRMPGASGVQATRRLRAQESRAAVIILTSYGDQAYVRQALEAGADGYLLKSTPPEQLIAAIRATARGRRQLSPELIDGVLSEFGGLAREHTRREADLTEEDREILRHAGADEAVVRLETTDRLVRVTIADNGAGFDTDAAARPTALGLLSMRERAGAIGASFAITSRPGDGTRVTVERPIAAQADDGLAEIDDAAAADPAADGAPPAATLAGAGAAAPRDGGGS